MPELVIRAKMW
jgi:hypothetical protein